MPTAKFFLCLVLVSVSGSLLAACGGDEVDAADAANTIQEQYPSRADNLELTSIECGTAAAEEGETFTCDAENDAGVSLTIEAEVNGIDGDQVDFSWSTTRSVSDGKAYAVAAVETLQAQGYAVQSMECPEIVIEKGTEVECETTMDDGSTQTATITLTDDNGGFDAVTSGPLG